MPGEEKGEDEEHGDELHDGVAGALADVAEDPEDEGHPDDGAVGPQDQEDDPDSVLPRAAGPVDHRAFPASGHALEACRTATF